MPDHAVLPIAIPPTSRPVSAADIVYLEAVQHALLGGLDHPLVDVKKWLPTLCPACDCLVPVGDTSPWSRTTIDGRRVTDANPLFWETHFTIARLVAIDCLGRWLVDPASIGLPKGGWVDWRDDGPAAERAAFTTDLEATHAALGIDQDAAADMAAARASV